MEVLRRPMTHATLPDSENFSENTDSNNRYLTGVLHLWRPHHLLEESVAPSRGLAVVLAGTSHHPATALNSLEDRQRLALAVLAKKRKELRRDSKILGPEPLLGRSYIARRCRHRSGVRLEACCPSTMLEPKGPAALSPQVALTLKVRPA